MLGVEGTGGQEKYKLGTWKCPVGYAEKTSFGTDGEGPEMLGISTFICGYLGATDIFKQARDRASN